MPVNEIIKTGESRFLNMFTVDGVHNGEKYQWDMCSRSKNPKFKDGDVLKPDAVHIIARIKHNSVWKMVVTKEFRIPLQTIQIGSAAGLIDEDSGDIHDDILQSAQRELREETGLDIIDVFNVSMIQSSSAGAIDETFAVVYCDAIGELSTSNLEDGEHIETELWSRKQVSRFLESKQKFPVGPQTEIIFQLFAQTGCIHPSQLAKV